MAPSDYSIAEQMEQILQKLLVQRDTIDEMLRANIALNVRFGEILESTSPGDQSSNRETVNRLLKEQMIDIENFRRSNGNLLDHFTRQLHDLRLRSPQSQNRQFSNVTGIQSSKVASLESSRKVLQLQTQQFHSDTEEDELTPQFPDLSNGTQFLSRSAVSSREQNQTSPTINSSRFDAFDTTAEIIPSVENVSQTQQFPSNTEDDGSTPQISDLSNGTQFLSRSAVSSRPREQNQTSATTNSSMFNAFDTTSGMIPSYETTDHDEILNGSIGISCPHCLSPISMTYAQAV